MRLAAFAMWIALLAPAAAWADDWTMRDTALEATYAAVQAADWRQTLDIGAAGREINPILGPRPSAGAVHAYFAATLVGHALIARALPRPWRETWQLAWIAIETGTVARNVSLGWRIQF